MVSHRDTFLGNGHKIGINSLFRAIFSTKVLFFFFATIKNAIILQKNLFFMVQGKVIPTVYNIL